MSRYILDTEHVTLFQHNHPEVARRARTVGGSNIFVTTVTLDDAAYNCYQSLRQQQIRIGTQDLRIAAIALANQAVVVTRNQQDFIKIPDLAVEDWTV